MFPTKFTGPITGHVSINPGLLAHTLNCAWITGDVNEAGNVDWRWRMWVPHTGDIFATGEIQTFTTPAVWEEALPLLTAVIRMTE